MNVFVMEDMFPLFDLMDRCRGIEQEERWHPEKDVLQHLLQVMHIAFRETIDTDLIIAAMIHDVGKADMRLRHEMQSSRLVRELVSEKTHFLVANHMRIWTFIDGQMNRVGKVTALVTHPWFVELVHLARIDKKGRVANKTLTFELEDKCLIVERLNKCATKHFRGIRE